jgi:hypothetical protein
MRGLGAVGREKRVEAEREGRDKCRESRELMVVASSSFCTAMYAFLVGSHFSYHLLPIHCSFSPFLCSLLPPFLFPFFILSSFPFFRETRAPVSHWWRTWVVSRQSHHITPV